jgi:hypothetical protein
MWNPKVHSLISKRKRKREKEENKILFLVFLVQI